MVSTSKSGKDKGGSKAKGAAGGRAPSGKATSASALTPTPRGSYVKREARPGQFVNVTAERNVLTSGMVKTKSGLMVNIVHGKQTASGKPRIVVLSASKPMTLFERMGGLLGEDIHSEMDIVTLVTRGLRSSSLETMESTMEMDVRLIAPESTLRRRIHAKQPLTVDESERLVRLARVTSLAEDIFGERSTALEWLNTKSQFVPGSAPLSPLELAVTDSGARIVEGMILRTAHGIF
jgi:putative toxin-antitoxin system antitoxin component (TIGR02293 family)